MVVEWSELESMFKEHARCDDGSVAEGFSDRVGYLLENRFASFRDRYAGGKRDSFFTFVVGHIDASISEETLRNIEQNAAGCGLEQRELCARIAAETKHALDEL